MTTTQLNPLELGCSEWFIAKDESIQAWIVARTYDTLDKDFETGEPCYGCGFDTAGEFDTRAQAEEKLSEVKGTVKPGYVLITE